MNGLHEVAELFEEAGVAPPPIPADLAPDLRRIHDWCYATRVINSGQMYMFDTYPLEVVTGATQDYVAVSHAGHGINSYGLNYHLVYGWIAVFVQIGWGGAYHGSDSVQRIEAWFSKCGDVLEAAARHDRRPQDRSGRLIVALSDFRGMNVCQWLKRPLSDEEGVRWMREHWRPVWQPDVVPALDDAVAWLNEREHMPMQGA